MSDLINPYLSYRVSQGWREGTHALPGGGPAIDYALPMRTPIVAPCAGVLERGSAPAPGLNVTVHRDDGSMIVQCHLDSFGTPRTGDQVAQGQVLGYSGMTGVATGPHVHTYGLHANGARWDWTIDAAAEAAAGGEVKPFPVPKDDEDGGDVNNFYFYADPAGAYGFFNRATGKARKVSRDEWEFVTAVNGTRGGSKYDLVQVSQNWYDRAFRL